MPYRNERRALEDRRDELTHRLAYIADEAERSTLLQTEVDALRRDLASVAARLAHHEQRRALPVLEDLHVAAPCGIAWESMVGDDRVRHCGVCDKNVFNLSALTRDAAEELVAGAVEGICVRMYKREDGTVITADCPVGQRKRRRRLALVAVGVSAVAAAASATWAGVAHDGAGGPRLAAAPPTHVAEHVAPPQGDPPPVQVDVGPPRMVQGQPRIAPPWDHHVVGRLPRHRDTVVPAVHDRVSPPTRAPGNE